jgi:hypothetical protein
MPPDTAGWEACRYQRRSAPVTGCSGFGVRVYFTAGLVGSAANPPTAFSTIQPE